MKSTRVYTSMVLTLIISPKTNRYSRQELVGKHDEATVAILPSRRPKTWYPWRAAKSDSGKDEGGRGKEDKGYASRVASKSFENRNDRIRKLEAKTR